MRNYILYIVLLIICSCSNKIVNNVKPVTTIEFQQKNDSIKLLSGTIYPKPKAEIFYSAILLLNYNDSIKIYAGSDLDGNFTFYDFKPNLINDKSYIYVANKGCISKKIMFNDLKQPINITLKQDLINGLTHEEYMELLTKNRPID